MRLAQSRIDRSEKSENAKAAASSGTYPVKLDHINRNGEREKRAGRPRPRILLWDESPRRRKNTEARQQLFTSKESTDRPKPMRQIPASRGRKKGFAP